MEAVNCINVELLAGQEVGCTASYIMAQQSGAQNFSTLKSCRKCMSIQVVFIQFQIAVKRAWWLRRTWNEED